MYSWADPVTLGVKAGVTNCQIYPAVGGTGTFYFGGAGYYGFNVGLFSDIKIYDFLSFQPELLYVLKGDEDVYSNPNYPSYRYPFPYLEIPLLLKGKVLTIQDFKANLLFGPYTGLLLQGLYSPSVPAGFPASTTPSYNPLDWGFDFGASFELGNFVLDARLELGEGYIYNNTLKSNDGRSINGFGQHLDGLFSLGYEFWSL